MVNIRRITGQASNQLDDAMKTFITDIINVALASSMKSVTRSFQEQLDRIVIAMNTSVNGVCMRQDTLAADVQRFTGETGTSNRNVNKRITRIAKIKFPKFHGDDPTGWMYRCNQFFKVDDIVPEDKVKLASMHLYDKALAWHQQFTKIHGENMAWEVYVEALLKRFSSTYEDPMSELKNIRQKGGLVQLYIDAFDLIMTKVDVPEAQDVKTNNSVSRKINNPLISTSRPVYNNFVRNPGAQVPIVNYNSNRPKLVYNNAPYKKQLTQKELDEKRAKNQCFYYDQKYVPSHQCSGKLFSLEIVEDNGVMRPENEVQYDEEVFGYEDNADENRMWEQNDCNKESNMAAQPQISLNAISGGETFQANMMLIPLGGYEMVLGVQWLATLGGIVWNFVKMKMEFMYQERRVAIRGAPQLALQWMQGKPLGANLFSMALCVYPSFGVQVELIIYLRD
ncbi:immune-associated nucleotide-binding protein 9 [Tanacetum coccineum]